MLDVRVLKKNQKTLRCTMVEQHKPRKLSNTSSVIFVFFSKIKEHAPITTPCVYHPHLDLVLTLLCFTLKTENSFGVVDCCFVSDKLGGLYSK